MGPPRTCLRGQECSKLVSDVRNRTPAVYRWGEGLSGKVFAGVVALPPLEPLEEACASYALVSWSVISRLPAAYQTTGAASEPRSITAEYRCCWEYVCRKA